MLEKPLTLATANASWVADQDDNDWIIKDNNSERIGKFPSSWSQDDCIIALTLARKYELEAFNVGIAFGKETRDKYYKKVIESGEAKLEHLRGLNENLASKLEKMIIQGG